MVGVIDPATGAVSVTAIASLALLHHDATVVLEERSLVVAAATGPSLVVPPDEQYEGWTFTDAEGAMFVSTPGGDVSRFGPPE